MNVSSMKKKLLNISILFIYFSIIIVIQVFSERINLRYPCVVVTVEKCDLDDEMQLFYDIGNGINEKDSIKRNVKKSEKHQKCIFKLPDQKIYHFRLDFGERKGNFYLLKSIKMTTRMISKYWQEQDLIRDFRSHSIDVNKYKIEKGMVTLYTTGKDSFLVSPIFFENTN